MSEKLNKLQNIAEHYQNEIKKQKKELDDYRKIFKRDNPLNIYDYQAWYPCTGFHYEEDEQDLQAHQKHYAYLLYFRKLLRLTEKEIRKEKLRIKEKQREHKKVRNEELT